MKNQQRTDLRNCCRDIVQVSDALKTEVTEMCFLSITSRHIDLDGVVR